MSNHEATAAGPRAWDPVITAAGLAAITGAALLWCFEGTGGAGIVDVVIVVASVVPRLQSRLNRSACRRVDRGDLWWTVVAVAALLLCEWLTGLVPVSVSAPGDHTLSSEAAAVAGHYGVPAQVQMILALVIMAPALEEVAMRGALLIGGLAFLRRCGLNPRAAAAVALVGTTVIFALGHTQYSTWGQITVAINGLILGALMLKTRNILLPVTGHALWNGLVVVQVLHLL